MCGIAGLLNWHGRGIEGGLLERMIDVIRHRGPDEEGFYRDSFVGLAHARLSIIDLERGGQPMSNEDGTLWIVFNGEIFNYVELREELLQKGHRFSTSSDTEVILHLYEELGERCVERLNGQWAFAIWNTERRRLFLSRDRLGIRPLFYARTADGLAFASEVKSLFACPPISRELDLQALNEVFTFWTTTPPATIFKAVRELPPGQSLTVDGRELRTWSHWQLVPREGNLSSEEAYAERLMEILVDATRLRLRSDVPVATYLSGGLDSTVTTAVVKRETGAAVKSFSVAFEDPDYDESRYQRIAAEALKTDHESIRCSYQDICDAFPRVIWHAEKPILRTAPVPLFLLSKLVRENGFKVVVTGEGADEMLGGYDIFKEAKIRRFCNVQPDSKFRPLLLRRLYPYMQGLRNQPTAYLKAFFRVDREVASSPFFSHLPRWDLTRKAKIFFSDDVRAAVSDADPELELERTLPAGFRDWDYFTQAQYLESTILMPGYILSSQGDRMAMAHSVEGRFPFLDHRIAEFALGIPASLKMKVLDEKYLLKLAARSLVPQQITRRSKQPFRAPDARSFFDPASQSARADYVDEMLSEEALRKHGIFDPASVGSLVRKVKSGRPVGVKDDMALVGILSTQLVLEQFVTHAE